MEILDSYVKTIPNDQNAVDIFKGEWSSLLPGNRPVAGTIPLFEDGRITWAVAQFGGIQGYNVLELGPLEGGHTYMLEKSGAASITAIEANSRAYLKCLIVKEILNLQKTRFLLGDCIEYLRAYRGKFDVCIASGILYHMTNPVELLALMAKISDKLFVWTHYFSADVIHSQPNISHKFPGQIQSEYNGFKHTLYRQEYKVALDNDGFCGGSDEYSYWLSRNDILACLKYFGFKRIEINFDHPNHVHGPSFAFVAYKY